MTKGIVIGVMLVVGMLTIIPTTVLGVTPEYTLGYTAGLHQGTTDKLMTGVFNIGNVTTGHTTEWIKGYTEGYTKGFYPGTTGYGPQGPIQPNYVGPHTIPHYGGKGPVQPNYVGKYGIPHYGGKGPVQPNLVPKTEKPTTVS